MPLSRLDARSGRTAARMAAAGLGKDGELTAAGFWAAFALLFLVAALPVLRVELPPLFDYPNHLARMDLLVRLPGSEALQRYYELRWRIIPNLGMDLVVPMLARVLPLAWAGKAFVLATFALVAAGAGLMHRAAAGRWSLWPLFAFLFLYSRVLLWGFLNYLFGIGLALVGLALWIALSERSAVARLALSGALALALFFAHLMACVVYGVLIAGYEVGALWQSRPWPWGRAVARLAIAGLPFLPPLALWLLARDRVAAGVIHYGRLDRKLDLLFSIFDNYDRIFDIACFVLLVLAAGFGYAKRHLVIVPALRLPLALLGIVYLAAPAQLMTASAVDHRLPLVIAVVLAAGTSAPALPSRLLRLVALAGLVLFLARMAQVWVHWSEADAVYARLLPILDQVPRGGRLAVGYPPQAIGSTAVPTTHIPVLAIVRRDAFVPTLFAYRGQQPVALTPEGEHLASLAQPDVVWRALVPESPGGADLLQALREFDAVLLLDRGPFAPKPMRGLVPLAGEPGFELYRVEP